MSYDAALAKGMCEKFRADALPTGAREREGRSKKQWRDNKRHKKQQRGQKQTQNEASQGKSNDDSQPVPTDVDASTSRFRQSTAHQKPQGSGRHNPNYGYGGQRPANSDRASGQRRERATSLIV